MSRTLLVCLLCFCYSYSPAKSRWIYSDRYVTASVEWDKDEVGQEKVILTLKPLAEVLIPMEGGCFSLDSGSSKQWKFRNFDCAVYKNGRPFYVINDGMSNRFRLVSQDTVLTYEWQVPTGAQLDGFSFGIEYISIASKEYLAKKKGIMQMPDAKWRQIFYIKQEDETILRSRAHLEVLD